MQVTELQLDQLQAHPSQFLFHDLGGEEWKELVKDVTERGIQQPITVSRRTGTLTIVDGHQRARAAKEAGLPTIPAVEASFTDERAETLALVMANIRRRHLSRDERRQVIAQMLKLYPEKSNRQHAESLGVDHKTVKAERQNLEALGEIPQVDRVTTSDGKSRPISQAPSRPKPAPIPARQPVVDISPARDPEPEELEPYEVDHSIVIDLTPAPFEQHLKEIGYEEARSFENLAVKLISSLTEFKRYSATDLIAVSESKAGRGLMAHIRLRRIEELMGEVRELLKPEQSVITLEAMN